MDSKKKEIDIAAFQRLCEQKRFHRFCYATENQPWDDGGVSEVCRQRLTFQNIRIALAMPKYPAITLTGQQGAMACLNVRKIEVQRCTLGNVFTIHCMPWEQNRPAMEYIIIANEN